MKDNQLIALTEFLRDASNIFMFTGAGILGVGLAVVVGWIGKTLLGI